jgi:hypothetical protein
MSDRAYTEAILKAELMTVLRQGLRGSVVLRHEDIFRAGVPDTSVTWRGHTIWLEVKLARPTPRGKDIQKITCAQLAVAGICYYVIYRESSLGIRDTMVIHPREIVRGSWPYEVLAAAPDFNHDFVMAFLRGRHDHGRS